MSKKTKILIAVLVMMSIIIIAHASYSSEIFLPMTLYNVKLVTPTATPIPEIRINYIEPGGYWDEYVRVKNRTTEKVDLTGWTIRNQRGNIYTFPNYKLGPNDAVKVWTQPGKNTETDLFWGSMREVWDDKSDCARLGNEYNEFVQWYCY